ncbi:MAG: 3-phosphoserine/phosphohydroxythreonine transaminase [Deltaproteobacteria bacterium]|nr:3-phosphoserine/phosphohydroxythreonine transaminase [Deltaproteobacteria bacterium]
MAKRVFNFNPGPAALPLEVLKQVQEELLDFKGTGMSILEISHRAKEFEEVNNQAMALIRELAGVGNNYKVLFLGGGASTQFSMVPMNFLAAGKTACYVDTGEWASKAAKEAKRVGNVNVLYSSKEAKYDHVPKPGQVKVPADAAYLHVTSNNTIFGTEYTDFPDAGSVPLFCDMSSDMFGRTRAFDKFSLIYAGAQKNLGPAGVTIVMLKDELLAKCPDNIPTMLNYKTHAEKDSLYNTPPVFGIYVVKLVMEWVKKQGGLKQIEAVNRKKKDAIYKLVDEHPNYFKGTVQKDSRSWMNLTLRLPSEDLEKKLTDEAKKAGFVGLKGHRSVGGVRVSLYNAVPLEGAEKLAEFMLGFMKANPK